MPTRQGQQICHYISFLIHENQTPFHSLLPPLTQQYTARHAHSETRVQCNNGPILETHVHKHTHTHFKGLLFIAFPQRSNCMHPQGREGFLEKSTAGSLRSSVSLLEWQTIDCILCVCFSHLLLSALIFVPVWQFLQTSFLSDPDIHFVYFPLNSPSGSP